MNSDDAKAALHLIGLSETDRLLIVLMFLGDGAHEVRNIREAAITLGVRQAKNWNISQKLARAKNKAINLPRGWELSDEGRQHLGALGISKNSVVTKQAASLRNLLPNIKSEKNRDFVAEAVSCLERGNLRAAVVLSWVGAISVLYDYVIQHKLTSFNTEWVKRLPLKNKPITCVNDLSDIKEDTFLDILHTISLIGKSVKDELKGCLKFRNGCGHPNTLVVGEVRAAAHLETLVNNVYKIYS